MSATQTAAFDVETLRGDFPILATLLHAEMPLA
jgi:hypothetical protein